MANLRLDPKTGKLTSAPLEPAALESPVVVSPVLPEVAPTLEQPAPVVQAQHSGHEAPTTAEREVDEFEARYADAKKADEKQRRFQTLANHFEVIAAGRTGRPLVQPNEHVSRVGELMAENQGKAGLYNALRARHGLSHDKLAMQEKQELLKQQARERELRNRQLDALEDPNSASSLAIVETANQMLPKGAQPFVAGQVKGSQILEAMPWLKERFDITTRTEDRKEDRALRREQIEGAREDRREAREAREEQKQAIRESKMYFGSDWEVPDDKKAAFSVPEAVRGSFINASAAARAVAVGVAGVKSIAGENGEKMAAVVNNPAQRGRLIAEITNLQMSVKEYYNLGALTGPDLALLGRVTPQIDSSVAMAIDAINSGRLPDAQRELAALYHAKNTLEAGIKARAESIGLRPVGGGAPAAPAAPAVAPASTSDLDAWRKK